MEKLEIKTGETDFKPEMRCQGMCSGSCSCPTGYCKCKGISMEENEVYLSGEEAKYQSKIPDSTSYVFSKAA